MYLLLLLLYLQRTTNVKNMKTITKVTQSETLQVLKGIDFKSKLDLDNLFDEDNTNIQNVEIESEDLHLELRLKISYDIVDEELANEYFEVLELTIHHQDEEIKFSDDFNLEVEFTINKR